MIFRAAEARMHLADFYYLCIMNGQKINIVKIL